MSFLSLIFSVSEIIHNFIFVFFLSFFFLSFFLPQGSIYCLSFKGISWSVVHDNSYNNEAPIILRKTEKLGLSWAQGHTLSRFNFSGYKRKKLTPFFRANTSRACSDCLRHFSSGQARRNQWEHKLTRLGAEPNEVILARLRGKHHENCNGHLELHNKNHL